MHTLWGMHPVEPILTAPLFPGLHDSLMDVLHSLQDEDWTRPTAAGAWQVRDIAAHLVDGNVRQISFRRDGLVPVDPEFPIRSYADLVRFIDGLNAVWVKAFQRASPRLLRELLEMTGPPVSEIFANLDPFGEALFGVAWAGEMSSTNWFDTAREYTERWHHQQQIRDAVGAESITGREWLHPVLDTFLRGLPHAYREATEPDGTSVLFEITGEAGGTWSLRREDGGWRLYAGASPEAAARLRTDQDTAWRLLTKGLSQEMAAGRVHMDGAATLGRPFLHMLAIMG
jgi:uncharacterized protein (TIGR03083 family)